MRRRPSAGTLFSLFFSRNLSTFKSSFGPTILLFNLFISKKTFFNQLDSPPNRLQTKRQKMNFSTEHDPNLPSKEDLIHNLKVVQERLLSMQQDHPVRLVAVSKTKPVEAIQWLYDEGQRHFGENYFQELVEKSSNLPKDIQWHFIGHLQSSKAKKLISQVPNLYVLETLDSEKLAAKLEAALESEDRSGLNVFIQVDTSGEESKSGVSMEELPSLIQFIIQSCPRLKIQGLMTIGAPGDYTCFDKLRMARDQAYITLETLLGREAMPNTHLELSMGMSSDYLEAIQRGATSVRVGSTIFGPRIYHAK